MTWATTSSSSARTFRRREASSASISAPLSLRAFKAASRASMSSCQRASWRRPWLLSMATVSQATSLEAATETAEGGGSAGEEETEPTFSQSRLISFCRSSGETFSTAR